MKCGRIIMLCGTVWLVGGCMTMKHQHQLDQTKPLEINVNVKLQVDRELDEFFAFEEKYESGAATQPAS